MCTIFFNIELFSVILFHSGFEFNILYNLIESYEEKQLKFWKFLTNFVLKVWSIARREIQIVDELLTASSAKTKNWGKFLNLNDFILSHINSF